MGIGDGLAYLAWVANHSYLPCRQYLFTDAITNNQRNQMNQMEPTK